MPTHAFQLHLMSDELWSQSGSLQRSRELTPLYIERFSGPLIAREPTMHEHWEWVYVLDGKGQLEGDIPLPLDAGTACLLPPGTGHIEIAPDPIDLVWLGLAGSMLADEPRGHLRYSSVPTLRDKVLEIWETSRRPFGHIGSELDGMARQLIGVFCRIAAGESIVEVGRIERVLRYLNEAYAEDLPMSDVASRFGLSEGHFYREFKRHCGMTPVGYLTQVRLRHAIRWLRDTDEPVTRIAALTGFRDARYFSRICRRFTGQNPTELRLDALRPASERPRLHQP
jgi:AraC-like DNA-binding protein